MLRFRVLGASFSSFGCFVFDLGCFVFEIWVLRASVFVFECFVFETTHVHHLLSLLRLVRTIATWKTVIESMQSLGMDKFRVAFTRFLAFYSDNPSGLHDGETPAKWQSKASFATHPSTEPEWPPKLLTRFSS